MALTFNNTSIAPSYTVKENSTALKSLKFGSTEVWKSAVTLVNLIGSAAVSYTGSWGDAGYDSFYVPVKTIATVPGHRYYVRAAASSWASPYNSDAYDGYCNAEFIVNVAVRNATGHAIVTATSASHVCAMTGGRYNSSQGGVTATFYMVVDLTELEAAAGKTYTADSFWAAIGSKEFYGSKEQSL